MGNAWSPDATAGIVESFLDRSGLAEPNIDLVRFHQNAVYRLHSHGLTVRIYGPEDGAAKARLMIAFACGVVGLLMLPRTYRDFLSWPGMLLTGMVIIITATGLLAALGPARRGLRVDPRETLNAD